MQILYAPMGRSTGAARKRGPLNHLCNTVQKNIENITRYLSVYEFVSYKTGPGLGKLTLTGEQ